MLQKLITNYFLKGFALSKRSLDLLIISLLLSLAGLLSNYTQSSFIIVPLSLISSFISVGFMLSLPIFLVQKQEVKSLNYRNMVKVTLKNTKRIILPGILLFILLGISLMLSFAVAAIFLHINTESEINAFTQNVGKVWHPISLLTILMISFFEFTSFFFSLEGNGLLSSLRKSIIAGFNNLRYVSIVILISIISSTITSFIPIETFWGRLLTMVLGGYVVFVVNASSLYYYQTRIKKSV